MCIHTGLGKKKRYNVMSVCVLYPVKVYRHTGLDRRMINNVMSVCVLYPVRVYRHTYRQGQLKRIMNWG